MIKTTFLTMLNQEEVLHITEEHTLIIFNAKDKTIKECRIIPTDKEYKFIKFINANTLGIEHV